MATKAKRQRFTVQEKLELLEESLRPGFTLTKAAKTHGISRSTLAGIIKDKEKILDMAAKGQTSYRKQSQAKEEELEDRLFEWILAMHAEGIHVDSVLLRRQAETLAKEMNVTSSLTFSHGWEVRFRKRHGIQGKNRRSGEQKQNCEVTTGHQWLQHVLPSRLLEFEPSEIYSAAECTLFYRDMLSRASVVWGNEEQTGNNAAAHRLTTLVITNMDGSDKLPLLVIGSNAHPCGFARNLNSFPVQYEFSPLTELSRSIWSEHLRRWDLKLRAEGRNVLLLVDHAPNHPYVKDLTNIKMEFLPVVATTVIQPCNAGIIRNMKGFYCSELTYRILALQEIGEPSKVTDVMRKISILDAIYMASHAWKAVKASTIVRSFGKAFSTAPQETFDSLADVPLPPRTTREELGAIVDKADLAERYTTTDVTESEAAPGSFIKEEQDDTDDGVSVKECLEALNTVRRFCQEQGLEALGHESFRSIERTCLLKADVFKMQKDIMDKYT